MNTQSYHEGSHKRKAEILEVPRRRVIKGVELINLYPVGVVVENLRYGVGIYTPVKVGALTLKEYCGELAHQKIGREGGIAGKKLLMEIFSLSVLNKHFPPGPDLLYSRRFSVETLKHSVWRGGSSNLHYWINQMREEMERAEKSTEELLQKALYPAAKSRKAVTPRLNDQEYVKFRASLLQASYEAALKEAPNHPDSRRIRGAIQNAYKGEAKALGEEKAKFYFKILQLEAYHTMAVLYAQAYRDIYRRIRKELNYWERRAFLLLHWGLPVTFGHPAFKLPQAMDFLENVILRGPKDLTIAAGRVWLLKKKKQGGRDLARQIENAWKGWLAFYRFWVDWQRYEGKRKEEIRRRKERREWLNLGKVDTFEQFDDRRSEGDRFEDSLETPEKDQKPGEILTMLIEELERVAPRYAEYVRLRGLGYSFREIAEKEGIREDTVKDGYYNGIRKMREIAKQKGFGYLLPA